MIKRAQPWPEANQRRSADAVERRKQFRQIAPSRSAGKWRSNRWDPSAPNAPKAAFAPRSRDAPRSPKWFVVLFSGHEWSPLVTRETPSHRHPTNQRRHSHSRDLAALHSTFPPARQLPTERRGISISCLAGLESAGMGAGQPEPGSKDPSLQLRCARLHFPSRLHPAALAPPFKKPLGFVADPPGGQQERSSLRLGPLALGLF
jgi:hypothetical protein